MPHFTFKRHAGLLANQKAKVSSRLCQEITNLSVLKEGFVSQHMSFIQSYYNINVKAIVDTSSRYETFLITQQKYVYRICILVCLSLILYNM